MTILQHTSMEFRGGSSPANVLTNVYSLKGFFYFGLIKFQGSVVFCQRLVHFLCATMYEYNTSMKSDVHDLL